MNKFEKLYDVLLARFGPQHWWPAETPFEVCVGAILTQNTAWVNVEKAIAVLNKKKLLCPRALRGVRHDSLGRAIRSSGYYNQKAKRLKLFAGWFGDSMRDSFGSAKGIPTPELRDRLLAISGIGPETADSMLLYAFGRASFVVDAYTCRVVERHGLIHEGVSYREVKELFESNLKKSVRLYREYHALLVQLGKHFCRPTPRCTDCPVSQAAPAASHRILLDFRR